MHTVFALLCFVVVIHWLIFPYPSGSLHWHCGNLTIAPVPAKQPWWIWIDTSCEFIMNDCITTTKQSTTKPWAYFLGYTVSKCAIRDVSFETETAWSMRGGQMIIHRGKPCGLYSLRRHRLIGIEIPILPEPETVVRPSEVYNGYYYTLVKGFPL